MHTLVAHARLLLSRRVAERRCLRARVQEAAAPTCLVCAKKHRPRTNAAERRELALVCTAQIALDGPDFGR